MAPLCARIVRAESRAYELFTADPKICTLAPLLEIRNQATPIRNKLCLNEGLLKTEREPHGITKMIDGRMRALDTAESNAITT